MPARRLRPEFTSQVNQHITHGHFWSPAQLRRILRERPAGHHPAAHRIAKAPGQRDFPAYLP